MRATGLLAAACFFVLIFAVGGELPRVLATPWEGTYVPLWVARTLIASILVSFVIQQRVVSIASPHAVPAMGIADVWSYAFTFLFLASVLVERGVPRDRAETMLKLVLPLAVACCSGFRTAQLSAWARNRAHSDPPLS